MDWLSQPEGWIAFLSLTALEIVLGIDNIIFISIIAGELPQHRQGKARILGLIGAGVTRIVLLFCIALLIELTAPLFTVFSQELSARDLILLAGGLFLIGKSTLEIHEMLEAPSPKKPPGKEASTMLGVVAQIMLLDTIFSLDSVITAVGMVSEVSIMVAAIICSVLFMIAFVGPVARFVERRPTVKVLALSFLLLVGVALVAEGFDIHIPRGYIYFAITFSAFVELLNLKVRRRRRA